MVKLIELIKLIEINSKTENNVLINEDNYNNVLINENNSIDLIN